MNEAFVSPNNSAKVTIKQKRNAENTKKKSDGNIEASHKVQA